jgi:hypothetical protein
MKLLEVNVYRPIQKDGIVMLAIRTVSQQDFTMPGELRKLAEA